MAYKYLAHIEYCLKHNYIPYVDMQFARTMYSGSGIKNPWGLFFDNPQYHGLLKYQWIISDPGKGKQVVSEAELFGCYWALGFDRYAEKGEFIRTHLEINPEILRQVDEYSAEYDTSNCIGLYLRGTDYVSLKPKGHYIQPDLKEVFPVVDSFLNEYKGKILLVTEDKSYCSQLQERYGERLIVALPTNMIENYEEKKALSYTIEKQDILQNAREYFIKILLLARCRYLIAGKTNGSLMALLFNGGEYEKIHLFDKGLYE